MFGRPLVDIYMQQYLYQQNYKQVYHLVSPLPVSRILLSVEVSEKPRVDKCTGCRRYYVCPKRWLKTTTSCQCLSPKNGLFHLSCSPIKVGFLKIEKLANVQHMSTFVPCFRLFRSVVLAFAPSYHRHR